MSKTRLSLFAWCSLVAVGTACGASDEMPELCTGEDVRLSGQCLEDIRISVNSVGLLPERRKKAMFQGASPEYTIVNAETGEEVMAGRAEGPVLIADTAQFYTVDFSELTESGRYRIEANGQRSGTFEVGVNALSEAVDVAMLGLYGMRCGVPVAFEYDGETYKHGAGHLDEARLDRVGEKGETRDDTGGWHDAGDYGKYVRNGAFAVAFLLQAYEDFPGLLEDWEFNLPEQGGSTPDILDEARVELEWILKTQFADGSFAHKVTALGFEPEVMPESDGSERYFFSTSTTSTGNAVAVLAAAARIYEEFDADFAKRCLDAAERGQAFLDGNPQEIESDQEGAVTGTYGSRGDEDERAWALAELWNTTGKDEYLMGFEGFGGSLGMHYNYDWPETGNLAVRAYLIADRDGRDPLVEEGLLREVMASADDLSAASSQDPMGRGFDSYYWGSAGVVVRMSQNLMLAHQFYPNTAYLDAITARLDHVFGLNAFARSFVTGLGANPPQNPHHRPSRADFVDDPWPGLLIGGANPDALSWADQYESYEQNEVAINWNTALIYALVAAIGTQGDESAACVPDCVDPGPGLGGAGGAGAIARE